MKKTILITAAIFGSSSIILGAFGAHELKELLNPIQLNSFDTGVKYQMYHALFLLLVAQIGFLNQKALHLHYHILNQHIFPLYYKYFRRLLPNIQEVFFH